MFMFPTVFHHPVGIDPPARVRTVPLPGDANGRHEADNGVVIDLSTPTPTEEPQLRHWRGHWQVDLVIVAAYGAVCLATVVWVPAASAYKTPTALAYGFAVASVLALWWWRSAPLAALGGEAAIVVGNAMAGFAVGVLPYAVWLTLFSVFASSGWDRRRWALGVVVVGIAGFLIWDRATVDVIIMVGIAMSIVAAVVAGDAVSSRRALAQSQKLAGQLKEQERAAVVERVRLEERAQLARELHDSLGHAVNVIVMQAGVGAKVFDHQPQYARSALGRIETMGRDALEELDLALRVLSPTPNGRDQTAESSRFGLDEIGTLCDRIRATGRQVELTLEPVDVEPGVERTTYRIVQEAITNAARHSTSGTISVQIGPESPSSDRVRICVTNDAPTRREHSEGRGIVNMRERVGLLGGHFECGPTPEGFRVVATLPCFEADWR